MELEIECTNCGWQGFVADLLSHPDDNDKDVRDTRFVVCPDCGGIDTFEDIDDEEA